MAKMRPPLRMFNRFAAGFFGWESLGLVYTYGCDASMQGAPAMNEQQKQADELLEQVLGILGDAHELVQISVAIRTLTIIVGFALDMSEVECAAFAAEFSDVLTRLPKNRSTNLLNSTEKVYTTEQQNSPTNCWWTKRCGIVGDANDPVQISVRDTCLNDQYRLCFGYVRPRMYLICDGFIQCTESASKKAFHDKPGGTARQYDCASSRGSRRPSEFYRVLNRSTN